MPTKKPSNDSSDNNGITPKREAKNLEALLNNIVKEDDPTFPPLGTPYGEALRDSAASASSIPPPPAAPPQAEPPPMAKAAAAGKSLGFDLLKTAARAAVWFGMFLLLDGDPTPDPDDFN